MTDATALIQPRIGVPFAIFLGRINEDMIVDLAGGKSGTINFGQRRIKIGDAVQHFHVEQLNASCDIVSERSGGSFEDLGAAKQKMTVDIVPTGAKRPAAVASATAPAPKKTVQQMGAVPSAASTVSSGPSRPEMRRKLVHHLALHPRQTLGELRRAIIDNNDALQKELLLLLSAVAEKPDPGRYVLKADAYGEVEADTYAGYTAADRATVRENMRLASTAAGRDLWLTPISNMDDPLVTKSTHSALLPLSLVQ